MDLSFTKDELAFRDEVRAFFKDNTPPETRRRIQEGRHTSKQELVEWTRILNKKGWAVAHWPKEYGGTGWTPVQQYIFLEELQSCPAPSPLAFGVSMVGPVIYTFGNDAQKKQYLPRIANLDDWWCQALLRARFGIGPCLAEDDGEEGWRQVYHQRPEDLDHLGAARRHDLLPVPHQCGGEEAGQGISFIVFDMKSKGVTVRPIQTIDGGVEVNEVFFDDVEVPVENLIGQENKGWDYAKFLLGNERTNIARVGMSKERIRRIKELASTVMAGDQPIIKDARFLEKLTATEIELKALELTQMRVVANESKNGKGKPDPASSILKIKGSDIQQTITELLLEVTGPFAMPFEVEDETRNEPDDWASPIAPGYFNYRKVSIYGGSNEIQRNIIAKAVLGL